MNSPSEPGRSVRSSSSSPPSTTAVAARTSLSHAARFSAERTCSSTRQRLVDIGERAVGVDHRPAELDERIARQELAAAGAGRDRIAELVLELHHDPLRRLAPDPGDRLEPRQIVTGDRAAQLGRRRPRDDRERHLRPDPGHAEEQLEELALVGARESVELERVLADVQVRLDGRLLADPRSDARRRRDQVADTADVEHDPGRRARGNGAAQARDHASLPKEIMRRRYGRPRTARSHPIIRSSGGASAWQIATASASAA